MTEPAGSVRGVRSHWPILLERIGITKPRLRMYGGYWECAAAKDGELTLAYGETPERAWRWWKFYRLNHAPPASTEVLVVKDQRPDEQKTVSSYPATLLLPQDN